MAKRADEILMDLADLFRQRNQEYGNTYWMHGHVMRALFPEGLRLETEGDFTRLGIINMIVSKLCRLCQNWSRGGHHDSAIDSSVYFAMLAEVEETIRENRGATFTSPEGAA